MERAVRKLALLALPGALLAAGHASAQPAREAWQAPTLSITRYDEDWSDLADAEKRAHHWTGPFKYIPITDDVWLSTGTELRLRSESLSGNQWGTAPDQTYLWARALPYADLHAGRFRAFVQPMATFATGVEPAASPTDQSRLDLLQGFAEADLGPVTLRGGRQMISLGTERLVGTRYGPNTPLAFDGARAVVRIGAASVSLLALHPVQAGLRDFDDHTSAAKGLWGAYAVLPGWDVYYLAYRNRNARFGGITGREMRHSIGLRSHGTRGQLHWNVEGVAQFGHFEGQNSGVQTIGAWTLGTEVGLALPHAMDATMRVNIISGDGKAGDGHLGTFNALFPKGKYFGELSPVGPANIVNLNPRFSAQVAPKVSASLAAMAFWRYSRGDGVYDIPGNLIRAAGAGHSRFIGGGGEATVAWQATPELELSSSFSVFAPGAFLRETGSTRTTTMLGLQANFRF
ncbi:alginate export family protein [Novosphingobium humi]|uniref:alginate export family protein n=1 Tax=Novosphingobium humi TaxID=2282397 RepID=UPI003EBF0475